MNFLNKNAINHFKINQATHFSLLLLLFLSGCGGSTEKADPISVDVAIAYVDRSLYTDADINEDGEADPVLMDVERPRQFNGGARLMIRNRTNQNAQVRDIIGNRFSGPIDIKDLSPSFDGTKLAFALREPQNSLPDPDDQPTWNLWEYNLKTDVLRRLIENNVTVARGNDINPTYLSDGKTLVFSSSRQNTGIQILLRENVFHSSKVAFAALTDSRSEDQNETPGIGETFNLHTLDTDTGEITQITFNQSHDLHPTVLKDGRIAFLRWDNYQRNGGNQSIYTINPDGTNLSLLYGYHHQNPVDTTDGTINATFHDLTTLPNGQLLALLKLRDSSIYPDFDEDFMLENIVPGETYPFLGGDLVSINHTQFVDVNQATNAGSNGIGQQSLYHVPINLGNSISVNGYINSAYPLNDGTNKLLISRTSCRLSLPNEALPVACAENLNVAGATEADPFYSLWLYDPSTTESALIEGAQEGRMFTDVVVLNDTDAPPLISSIVPTNPDKTGILHIESVYDFDGSLNTDATGGPILTELADPSNAAFATRPARFLRVAKAVSIPDDDIRDFDEGLAFGVANNRGMREILGYAPIEPDGSVVVKVPAEVAFEIDIVDATGKRLPEFPIHRNWLSLRPNEVLHCTGCHTGNSELPHGRYDAQASINTGAPDDDVFPNTSIFAVQGWTMATAYAARNVDEGIKVTLTDEIRNNADLSPSEVASYEAIIYQDARDLSPDLIYTDEWSLVPDSADDIALRYANETVSQVPIPDEERNVPFIPTNGSCIENWDSDCRIIINYEDHVQPLWDKARMGDLNGTDARNYACSSCHSNSNGTRDPAGQLSIDNDPSNNPPPSAYDELLRGDTYELVNRLRYQTDVDGNILYLEDDSVPDDDTRIQDYAGNDIPLIESADAQTDPADLLIQETNKYNELLFVVLDQNDVNDPNDDTLALDSDNNPIPLARNFGNTPGDNIPGNRMQDRNARNSAFFTVMTDSGNANNVLFDHTRLFQDIPATDPSNEPLITPEELRLISEWLDIGAQYYNNPFDTPLN